MSVLFRHIEDVVIDLVNTPSIGEALDTLYFLERVGGVAALQDDYIRLVALHLNVPRRGVGQTPLDPACPFQLGKWLCHPVMPYCRGVDWQCKDKG
ncbi:hypothetical protein D3C78_1336660 [compost metagenome]